MGMLGQIFANLCLYGFLTWRLYESTIAEWDPWFAVVVAMVLVVAIVISLVPRLHAPQPSPGDYPFED